MKPKIKALALFLAAALIFSAVPVSALTGSAQASFVIGESNETDQSADAPEPQSAPAGGSAITGAVVGASNSEPGFFERGFRNLVGFLVGLFS